jgi:hypothetical protein
MLQDAFRATSSEIVIAAHESLHEEINDIMCSAVLSPVSLPHIHPIVTLLLCISVGLPAGLHVSVV